MNKRTVGFILIVIGAVGLVVSLAADLLGIGTYPGINGAQWLGAIIGLIVALVGGWLVRSKEEPKK
jgi:hypothetical protein